MKAIRVARIEPKIQPSAATFKIDDVVLMPREKNTKGIKLIKKDF